MLLNHIGLVNRDEEDAILFYQDFLGLDKTRDFMVSSELAKQLFGMSREIKVLVFEKETFKIEVFISPEYTVSSPRLNHLGISVNDLNQFIQTAGKKGIQVIFGNHAGKTVYFIKDYSGNLVEIKQKHPSTTSG
jgi:catechol 2,3-dioxygenase-like lactoylglutathione lyase family enzyme